MIDKGIFMEYSNRSNIYRVCNSRTLIMEEIINVKFDAFAQINRKSNLEDKFAYLRILGSRL